MTKKELSKQVAEATGVQASTVELIINEITNTIKCSLMLHEFVYIRGFATFGIKTRAEKLCRNITKKTSVTVPEHSIPYAKFSKEFRNKIAGNNE